MIIKEFLNTKQLINIDLVLGSNLKRNRFYILRSVLNPRSAGIQLSSFDPFWHLLQTHLNRLQKGVSMIDLYV